MPHLTAPAVVEARPRSNTIVLKVGDALVSFDADEVPSSAKTSPALHWICAAVPVWACSQHARSSCSGNADLVEVPA